MPLENLPEPSRETLTNAPLEQVTWQVRHEFLAKASEAPAVLQLRERLGDLYPIIEQSEVAEFGLPGFSNKKAWNLRDANRSWNLIVAPDYFAIECTGYTTWTEFKRRALALLVGVEQVFSPALLQRVGLRYVDRLMRAQSARPASWNGLFATGIMGFASVEPIAEEVETVQTLQQFDFGRIGATMRTSCATDAGADSGFSMVIDTDCFDAQARRFDIEDVEMTGDLLHDANLRLFQQAVMPAYLRELEGKSR